MQLLAIVPCLAYSPISVMNCVCFLHFSECAAIGAGLQPQQHQLLLQVAGAPEATAVTIAYAAERLGLKHNSTVELVDRSEREGLLSRTAHDQDKTACCFAHNPQRKADSCSIVR